jgi:hypothetical protein
MDEAARHGRPGVLITAADPDERMKSLVKRHPNAKWLRPGTVDAARQTLTWAYGGAVTVTLSGGDLGRVAGYGEELLDGR